MFIIIVVTIHIIPGYAVTKRANVAEVKVIAISAISVFRLALLQKTARTPGYDWLTPGGDSFRDIILRCVFLFFYFHLFLMSVHSKVILNTHMHTH